ncbi:MAG: hypothetical protein AAF216_06340 [Pseudomonadota bacterium]
MPKPNSAIAAALACSTALFFTGCATAEPAGSTQITAPAPTAAAASDEVSFTVLEFGGPGILFAADQAQNRVLAFELGDIPDETGNLESVPYNLIGIGQALAAHLDVSPFDIVYNDLAVHPVTKAAFLSLSMSTESGQESAVVRITSDGNIQTMDLMSQAYSSIRLSDTPEEDVSFWRDIPATSLSVTDFEYDDGTLYIAGLSTGEFASTLRQVAYPFDGNTETTSVEMFHTAHDQNETRAPIRAMAMANVDGEKTLVAAYTCTPLVTIPERDLEDGAHVVGKTIAELGYGNRPLEVLSLTAYNMERQPEDFVLIINREMSSNLIRVEDMAGAPAITTAFAGLGDTLGVEGTHVPFAGTLQAADQDAQFILTLRRNVDTGDVDLISSMKGVYFRLSDFVSEYTFPDYTYGENQAGTQMFHNMVKPIEGYAELVIE